MDDSECSLNLTFAFAESLEGLPEVGQYYTFQLVEELVLEDNFSELIVGKCAVIGKLHQNADGDFELENINLPNCHSYPSVPEGVIKLPLLDIFPCFGSASLQSGRFCEACGEVCLVKKQTKQRKENEALATKLLTTHDLHLTLRQFKTATARQEYLALLQSTYTVALKLDFLKEIDNASKLAEYNLALREFYAQE